MSKCKRCQHMATKTTPPPSQFLLYGCRLKRHTFGLEADWKAGKWLGSYEQKKNAVISDMPTKCKEFAQ